jgi:filamentous hemagglutinin
MSAELLQKKDGCSYTEVEFQRSTATAADGLTSAQKTAGKVNAPRGPPGAGGIRANAEQGAAYEAKVGAELTTSADVVAPQITVKTASGTRTRVDFVTRDASGKISCVECKSSGTAPLTKNQARAFPEIAGTGATVVGRGKPGFSGGSLIPPAHVKIRRP